MKKISVFVLSLLTAGVLTLLTSCTADDRVDIIINTTPEIILTESSEITDSEAEELLGGDYIASLDFTDCKIGLIECHVDQADIVEYLSESETADFVDCLKNANISSVMDTRLQDTDHISWHEYEVLLNTGEKIYIGIMGDIIINGVPFKYSLDSVDKLRSFDKRLYRYEPTIEVSGSTLKDLDFTDCSVGVTDSWGTRIVGYMPDDVKEKFVECIKNADISNEENNDNEMAVGGCKIYAITLNTGEKLHIEPVVEDLAINGVRYPCDRETVNELYKFKIGVTYRGHKY